MSVTADVQRCDDATLERFGQIDILVTCAGSSPGGLLEDLTEEQWMSSLNLKFMGYVRSVVAALVTFLASPLARFINGAHIPIDGAQRKAIMDQ